MVSTSDCRSENRGSILRRPELSASNKALIAAYNKGYRVVDGVLFNPKGDVLKGTLRQGYFDLTYNNVHVRIHRLVAYQKYGNKMFAPGMLVRHKDGNAFNNKEKNILLGTQLQNIMDRLPSERRAHAIKASQVVRRFSDEVVKQIKKDRAAGLTYEQLCKKYKTAKSTLSYLFNKAEYGKK